MKEKFVVITSLVIITSCAGGKAEQKPSAPIIGILLDNPEAEKDPEWKQAMTAGRGSVVTIKDGDKDFRCVFNVKVSNDAYPFDQRRGPVELWDDSDAARQLQSGRRSPPATFRRKSRLMQIDGTEHRFEAIICEAPVVAEETPSAAELVAAAETVPTPVKETSPASPMSEETKKIWETAQERGNGSIFSLTIDGERRRCAYAKTDSHFGRPDEVVGAKIEAAGVLAATVCTERGCKIDQEKVETVRTRFVPKPVESKDIFERSKWEAVLCLI